MEFTETTHGEQLLVNNSNNIVFIDPTILNYQSLLTQLQTSKTILLDPTRDGIQQITEILAQQINVSSVQIISHGTSANLFLGNAQFNPNTIDRDADNLQSWTNALTADADILFYGCNFGAREAGKAFVQTLSQLTGADIGASDDLTGNATLGGDWELEVTTGNIESTSAFSVEAKTAYEHVFDPTINYNDFSDISNLKLNGNAAQAGNVLRLTPSQKKQRGSAFYTTPFYLNTDTSFQTHFQFQLSNGNGAVGGEGLTFMLQNHTAGSSSLGGTGQGLGYSGITKSIAIEFDTLQNSFDPNNNHVSILSKGKISPAVAVATPSFDLNSGNPINAWIDYNGSSNLLEVFLAEDTTKPTTALLSYTVDLVPILGSNFWTGFSGTTGTTFNNQDIKNWDFSATTLDPTSPTASLNAANIIVNNSRTYTFSVTYSDDNAVNVASLNSSDVRVTGPNGFNKLATLISVNNNSNGSPRTATYRIDAPGGTWNNTDLGTYNIALQANQVNDISGNFTAASTLGTFKAIETTPPTASLNTLNPVAEGDPTYDFTVTYSDNVAIASTTLDHQDILVTRNSGGFSQLATFISASNNGNNYTATYRITAPGETWNGQDNGTYKIVLQNNEVSDTSGNYIPTTPLGSFLVNFPANSGTISVSSDSIIVSEGNGTARVTFVRTDGSEGAASVVYSTTNNTALAGEDYTGITLNTVTFADGQTSATVSVDLIDDSVSENIEAFNVTIVTVDNANLGSKRTALVTLVDNDALPTLSFYQSPITINEADGTAVLTVLLNGVPSTNPVTVNYATSNGTAIAGSDYTTTSGTLQFTSGQIVKTIPISIIDNISSLLEPNKSLTVTLSNPIGADLTAENTGSIIIADDDSFVRENVITGLSSPTAIDWTPNGNRMYIALKGGVVRVYENGALLPTPFIDISAQVNNTNDRGLLSLAVHPDFPNTPYIYLLFTYDPPEVYNPENVNNPNNFAGADEPGNRPSRLIRVTADSSTDYRTVLPNSEVILLGKNSNWQNTSRPDLDSTADVSIAPSGVATDGTHIEDYLVTDSRSHSIGSVKFGPDGYLYVSNGDGASYNFTDPRAVRVQDLTSLSGKILRINPLNGEGLANNPFYDGNSNSNRSKVYDYGFRNPFRFTLHPTNGKIYISDVGWNTWEEINASQGGQNFGWPYYEGGLNSSGNPVSIKQPGYAGLPGANDFYTTVGPSVKAPTYAVKHTGGVSAIVIGDFYRGTTFPDIYRDALFFNDVQSGTIDAIIFNSTGGIASVQRFATGLAYVVEMETGPDSNLYYVNLAGGTIGRWRYTG